MRKVKTRLVERLVKGHTEWWLTPRMPDGVSHCRMSSSMKRFSPVRVRLLSMILLKRRPWLISGIDSHISALSKPLGPHVSLGTSCTRPSFAVLGSFHPSGMGSDMHTSCLPAVGPSLKWIQKIRSQAALQLQPPRCFLFRNSSKTLLKGYLLPQGLISPSKCL